MRLILVLSLSLKLNNSSFMLEYFKHASVQKRGKELLANEGGEPNADKGGGGVIEMLTRVVGG